ncbi:MAG TPA: hypothetical protein VK250_03310 [Nitrososphaeraceae archaeon]|nr:hypothetical protein [Nitrososphaeraceae archaeon]
MVYERKYKKILKIQNTQYDYENFRRDLSVIQKDVITKLTVEKISDSQYEILNTKIDNLPNEKD